MPYDPYGRTPEQARRDRRDAWGTALAALFLSALAAACVVLCCCGEPQRHCPCPCGCCEVVADGS